MPAANVHIITLGRLLIFTVPVADVDLLLRLQEVVDKVYPAHDHFTVALRARVSAELQIKAVWKILFDAGVVADRLPPEPVRGNFIGML